MGVKVILFCDREDYEDSESELSEPDSELELSESV